MKRVAVTCLMMGQRGFEPRSKRPKRSRIDQATLLSHVGNNQSFDRASVKKVVHFSSTLPLNVSAICFPVSEFRLIGENMLSQRIGKPERD